MTPSQSSGPIGSHSPASEALMALLQADDQLPAAWQATEIIERADVLIVLVDSVTAWSAWIVALYDYADQRPDAHVTDHLATATATVHEFPVTVVRGDQLPEMGAAA